MRILEVLFVLILVILVMVLVGIILLLKIELNNLKKTDELILSNKLNVLINKIHSKTKNQNYLIKKIHYLINQLQKCYTKLFNSNKDLYSLLENTNELMNRMNALIKNKEIHSSMKETIKIDEKLAPSNRTSMQNQDFLKKDSPISSSDSSSKEVKDSLGKICPSQDKENIIKENISGMSSIMSDTKMSARSQNFNEKCDYDNSKNGRGIENNKIDKTQSFDIYRDYIIEAKESLKIDYEYPDKVNNLGTDKVAVQTKGGKVLLYRVLDDNKRMVLPSSLIVNESNYGYTFLRECFDTSREIETGEQYDIISIEPGVVKRNGIKYKVQEKGRLTIQKI